MWNEIDESVQVVNEMNLNQEDVAQCIQYKMIQSDTK